MRMFEASGVLRRWAPWCAVGALLLAGCVLDEDYGDHAREVEPSMEEATLAVGADGAGELNFKFHYVLGLIDVDGVVDLRWTYRLVNSDQVVLAEVEEEFRKPEKDGVTQILVDGDRTRLLSVPGGLVRGVTYILWVELRYRDELIAELLTPVGDGLEDAPRPLD